MTRLVSTGEVMDRQSYLNGSRYFMAAGEADLEGTRWEWSLSATVPKEANQPLVEGDVILSTPDRTWIADLAEGSHHETIDDATDGPVIELTMRLTLYEGNLTSGARLNATGVARVTSDTCEISLELDL